jgi:23S rRNA (cytosine1962-C5)-methyltransferase
MFPILTLLPKKDRAVRFRHPWIFSGAVKHLPVAENGDIVEVRDVDGHPLAHGFFSPQSQIVCRLFDFDGLATEKASTKPGFVASPPPDFGLAYWIAKFARAKALRARFIDPASTTCYRLLHAEGDFASGIIADVYGDTVVLQILIRGTERLLPLIGQALHSLGYVHIFVKHKSSSQHLEGLAPDSQWLGERPELPLTVREHGLTFHVNPEKGQKTGFFIDQRENRRLLGELSAGLKVLNTFSYTAGFSVYALAGGATAVHSVDISKDAIALGDENVALNAGRATGTHQSTVADCFDYLRHTDVGYDLIVLDPPAFAKNAKSVPNAARGYKDLNLLAFRKVNPNGLVMTYSCSQNIDKKLFQQIVFAAAADAGRNIRIVRHLDQPADHPVNIFHPESEYLKGMLLWVE